MNITTGHEDRKLENLPRHERREQFCRIFQGHHLQDPHLSQLLQFFEQELHLPGQKPQTQVSQVNWNHL